MPRFLGQGIVSEKPAGDRQEPYGILGGGAAAYSGDGSLDRRHRRSRTNRRLGW